MKQPPNTTGRYAKNQHVIYWEIDANNVFAIYFDGGEQRRRFSLEFWADNIKAEIRTNKEHQLKLFKRLYNEGAKQAL